MIFTSSEARSITQINARTLKHWSEKGFLSLAEGNEDIGTGRSRQYHVGNLFEIMFLKALKDSYVPDRRASEIKGHTAVFFNKITILDGQQLCNPFRGEFGLTGGIWQVHIYDGRMLAIFVYHPSGLYSIPYSMDLDGLFVTLGVSGWDRSAESNFHSLIIVNVSNIIETLENRINSMREG